MLRDDKALQENITRLFSCQPHWCLQDAHCTWGCLVPLAGSKKNFSCAWSSRYSGTNKIYVYELDCFQFDFGRSSCYGSSAGRYEADFGLEPDFNAHKFDGFYLRKKAHIRIVQIRYLPEILIQLAAPHRVAVYAGLRRLDVCIGICRLWTLGTTLTLLGLL